MSLKPKGGEKVHYVASTTFTLDKCYSDLKAVGKGSYGVVCSAFSTSVDRKVAIKKITPMAKQITDAKHVLREIRLMRHMGKHENIVSLIDLAVRETADELYIVMELLDSDLHRILQSKQALTENHYRHFFHQLLCGLKYLHDNRIIHRDLKPGNLLVTKDCKLRITDFGLARERPIGKGAHADEAIDEPMTEHVVTRWYRPPELMLCPDGLYDYAVDIWSCGCILAEMLGRNPLFPGKNFVHQLSLVFDVIGTPPETDVAHIVNHEAKKFLSSQANKTRVPFQKIYPQASSDAWRLLDNLLVFNPELRFTVDEALGANYLLGVGLEASLIYPPTSPEFEFSFEYNPNVTRYQLKHMIAAEVTSFKREQMLIKARGDYQIGGIADTQLISAAATDLPVAAAEPQAKEAAQKQHKQASINRTNSSASIGQDKGDKNRAASAPRMRGNGSAGNLHAHQAPTGGSGGVKAHAKVGAGATVAELVQKAAAATNMTRPPLNAHAPVESASQHHVHGHVSSATSTSSTVDNTRHRTHNHAHTRDDDDVSTIRSGMSGAESSVASGADSELQTRDNSRNIPYKHTDVYDQLFKPKTATTSQHHASAPAPMSAAPHAKPQPPPKLTTAEMITRITASKQNSAAVVAALDAKENASVLKDFGNVSLPGYQHEMKSPAKSLRHPSSVEQQGKIADEYLYKSMDSHPLSREANKVAAFATISSPSRVAVNTKMHDTHRDSESSRTLGSPERASRRTIAETYLSPQRVVVAGKRADEDNFQPSITHSSPVHKRTATSPPSRKPMYNSLMGGFDQHVPVIARPQSTTYQQDPVPQQPQPQKRAVNVVSNSDSEEEKKGGDSDSSSDSSVGGAMEKVHIYSSQQNAQPTATSKREEVHQHTSGHERTEHKPSSPAGYYEQREFTSKFAMDENRNTTHVITATHTTQHPQPHRDESRTALAAADVTGGTKKKITVAKSPKFSQMSWQRRGGDVAPPAMPAPLPVLGNDKRASSAARHRTGHGGHEDEDEGKGREKSGPPAAPVPSYMNATGSYLNKTNTRSESASRTRR